MAREAVYFGAVFVENVYLEPTWTGVADMGMIYKELGGREDNSFLLDHVNNVTVQYETIKTVSDQKKKWNKCYIKQTESVYKITL